MRVDFSGASVDEAAASQGEEQAAGGDEISVETFEEREQGGGEDQIDDPFRGEAAPADGLLKGDGGHEFFTGELTPGSDEGDGSDYADVEEDADEDGHPDGAEEVGGAEFRAGFFGGFADGFESGHEIRDDLQDEENRDQRSVRKQRREIGARPAGCAERDEDHEESERAEAGPVLKCGAEADAAIVERGEQRGESYADDEVREIDGVSGDAVEFDGIEWRKNVGGDATDGNGFPGADDEVGEGHDPSGGEADAAGEGGGGVGDFAGGVGHGGDQLAVDPSDGEQGCAADDEAEKCAESAAAEEPVVHDDKPADTDHASPA